MPQRFYFIDALRGLAALWVVLFHIQAGGHIDQLLAAFPAALGEVVFEWGHLGVPIFFVLSGFVIAYCFRDQTVSLGDASRFAVRRAIRLDPPYWASMVLVIGYATVSAKVQSEPHAFPSLASLAAHSMYLQGILGFEPLSGIYWTLCQEIQFYIVFAALMCLVTSSWGQRLGGQRRMFLLVAGVSLLWPLGLLPTETWSAWWLPFWHGFLLGAFAYWAWSKYLPPAYFIVYAAVLGVAGWVHGSGFTVMCVLASALIYFAATRGRLNRWLSWQPLQWLGMISYSLYLTHTPINGAVGFVSQRLMGNSVAAESVGLVVQLFAAIAMAAVFYRLVERTCLHWSRRWSPRRTATASPPPLIPAGVPILSPQNDKDLVTTEKLVLSLGTHES